MTKKKYTKGDVISKVESWINSIQEAYASSEISTNCLVKEWRELRKEVEK